MNELGILEGLRELYGEKAVQVQKQLDTIIEKYKLSLPHYEKHLSEKDVVLITYADTIRGEGHFPLQTLGAFMSQNLDGLINTIHILPFFPFSSDDGFAVTDYYDVNPEFGTWDHIERLAAKYHLMFDAVINHVSKDAAWFKEFLAENPDYADFFIEVNEKDERIKQVFRPRALPLVHKYPATSGEIKSVWTTFSEDQIDLNYANGNVFITMLELLLFYISKGARLIRLDAVGFLWKRLGTNCINLPETHLVIQLYRKIIESLTSGILLITETNVPHKDNISYFGMGNNEAHMVYNFTLPPLLAFSLITSNVQKLVKWLSKLEFPLDESCYFNFTASHDGVGLQPIKGILTEHEIKIFESQVKKNKGYISFKDDADGTQSPYELNCTYVDLLSAPEDSVALKSKKFILSQAVMLSLPGVPGIYIHSLLGTENDVQSAENSGIPRRINRSKLEYTELMRELHNPGTLRNAIFSEYLKLLKVRASDPFFNPFLTFDIKVFNEQLFAIHKKKGPEDFWAVFNFSNISQTIKLDKHQSIQELIFDKIIDSENILIDPFGFYWLKTISQ